jgi:tetratricopeptide (TPR) repeat protein
MIKSLLALTILSSLAVAENLPPNVVITNAAWEDYNQGRYQQAIENAETCISDYEPDAIDEQRNLESQNIPMPPMNGPSKNISEQARDEILARGLLNDVATCWFIKARSLDKLKQNDQAFLSYCNTMKYTYARTYDLTWEGFWSPAEKARRRVSHIGRKCE